jgi:phage terminase large subunit-like protein
LAAGGIYAAFAEEQQMASELGGSRLHDEDMLDLDLAEGSPFAGLRFDAAPIRVASIRRDELVEVAVVVDPALTSGPQSDEWGIVVEGCRASGVVVVLEDLSGVLDDGAAGERIVGACERWRADALVAEINRGESRMRSVANAAWQTRRADAAEARRPAPRGLPPFVPVRTSKTKLETAGPAITLLRCGQVQHLPHLDELEAQALAWDPSAPPRPRQDDRINAWWIGVHYLARLGEEAKPDPAVAARAAFAGFAEQAVRAPTLGAPARGDRDRGARLV